MYLLYAIKIFLGTWLAAGSTAAPAVIGTVLGALAPAGPALADRESAIEVELLNALSSLLGGALCGL